MFEDVGDYIHKPTYGTGIAYSQLQLWIILLWRTISGHIYRKTIYTKGTSIDQVVNLPEDLQCIILSKLPLKEAVRTSVLSNKWRCLWTVCPKLRFDGTTIFGNNINGIRCEQYTLQFINTVNAVLEWFHGRVVEELAIKFEFDTLLVDHLNNWVQLRFVSIKLDTQFSGFPKLQKLDLRKVKITVEDFQDLLSSCCTLEWLSIFFCKMNGELKVRSPLPCLRYLNVEFCELTKMDLCATKLRTFFHEGSVVPISLREVSDLENVKMLLCGTTFGDVIPALANILTNVKNLTLNFYVHQPEVPCLMEIPFKFSHLKHLQLMLSYKLDIDNLFLVPFLGAAPFIEKLEIHFTSVFGFFLFGRSIYQEI